MLSRVFSFATITVLALVVLAACGSNEGGDEEDVTRVTVPGAPIAAAPAGGGAPAASPAASPGAPAVAQGGGAQTEFTLDMVDIKFGQAELTIPANTEVTINLPNKGAAVHNFVIDELGVKSEDPPGGATTSVTFSAPAGEYEFYCSQPGHKEAGMVGKLIVTEQAAPQPASGGEQPAAAAPPQGGAQQAPPPAGAGATFTVDMVDINYMPKEITVPANSEVTINLPNKGAAVHNFLIDELNVKSEDAPGGATTSVTFTAPAGEYQFYRSQPGHKEAGMVGTLIVQ